MYWGAPLIHFITPITSKTVHCFRTWIAEMAIKSQELGIVIASKTINSKWIPFDT